MRESRIAIALAFALLGTTAIRGSEKPDVGRDEALRLVKAFLYQDFVIRDGTEFTASVFADEIKNAVVELGLVGSPHLDAARSIVRADFDAHRDEYSVRSHMAQARTKASGDGSHEHWRRNLWEIFLADPRYVARILTALSAKVPLTEPPPMAPPLAVSRRDVGRIAPALAESLRERSKQPGCDSRPLTALPAVAQEDPALVTTIFRYFTTHDPTDRTVENAIAALRSGGWVVSE